MAGENENSYAGRWVARLRGKIVAQGRTPDEARRAAQSRYKETPEIHFMPLPSLTNLPPVVSLVRAVLPKDLNIYLVGGAIRDAILNQPVHDLDFALAGKGIRTARRVADALKASFYSLDEERDTGRVVLTQEDGTRMVMDFASFRSRADDPSAPTLESDLRGRDFTLNAIAMDLQDESLYDPLDGQTDLSKHLLRACSPSAFMDDPVRILRGVRLAASLGFRIQEETRQAMKAAAGRLGTVSPERLRDELFRMLGGLQPAACLRALDMLEALDQVLPELASLKGVEQVPPHVHDVWEHTLSLIKHLDAILRLLQPQPEPASGADVFNGLLVLQLGRFRQQLTEAVTAPLTADRSARSLLFMAALYHDIAKPQMKAADKAGQYHFYDHDQVGADILARRLAVLSLSNDEIQRMETVVRGHMRVHSLTTRLEQEGKMPSRRAIYRFFRDTGPAGVDICLLSLADLWATREETLSPETWKAALAVVGTLLEGWYEKKEERVAPHPLLDGNDLMRELALKPGPLVGRLLEAVREAQAAGEVTSRAQALDFARTHLEDQETP